jgi:hypothetical protein
MLTAHDVSNFEIVAAPVLRTLCEALALFDGSNGFRHCRPPVALVYGTNPLLTRIFLHLESGALFVEAILTDIEHFLTRETMFLHAVAQHEITKCAPPTCVIFIAKDLRQDAGELALAIREYNFVEFKFDSDASSVAPMTLRSSTLLSTILPSVVSLCLQQSVARGLELPLKLGDTETFPLEYESTKFGNQFSNS